MIDMLIGALIFALGLASGVFLSRQRKPTATAKPDALPKKGYENYRDPQTGLLSRKMVVKPDVKR